MTTEVDLVVLAILEVVVSTLVAVTTLQLVVLTTSVLLPLPLLQVIGLLLLTLVVGDGSNDMWSGCGYYRGRFCCLFVDPSVAHSAPRPQSGGGPEDCRARPCAYCTYVQFQVTQSSPQD